MEGKSIKERVDAEQREVERSFTDIASILIGEKASIEGELKRRSARNSREEICKYFQVDDSGARYGGDVEEAEALERTLRSAGYLSRPVALEGRWWRHGRSVMLARSVDNEVYFALIPRKFQGYTFFDYRTGRRNIVNALTAKKISSQAKAFVKPLPQCSLERWEVLRFLLGSISFPDFCAFVLLALFVTLLGFFSPIAYRYLIGTIAPTGQKAMILPAFFCLAGVFLGKTFLSMAKVVAKLRLSGGMEIDFQNAVMGRLMYLPSSFFSRFSTGEVFTQVNALRSLPSLVSSLLTESGLDMALVLLLLIQANKFGGPIVYVTLSFLVVEVAIALSASSRLLKAERTFQKRSSTLYTFIYNMYEGMQKLKNGAAEKRAFSRWASLYRKAKDPAVTQPLSLIVSSVCIYALSLVGTLAVCFMAFRMGLTAADYIAYTVAIGMITSAFNSVVEVMRTCARIRSSLDVGEPMLTTVPELGSGKQYVSDLRGKIDVNHATFRYPGQHTNVLNDCTISIKEGEYIALVGRTGSGKSTLVKLLMGFINLEEGAIYYDDRDIETVDLPSLRSHIGTVMQNGKLLAGDIRGNIAIKDPTISDEEIQRACEIAGIWEDIQQMPMGLHTFVGEGASGLSGGQKQRIMIARALVGHPKMMILDEAMSALDYQTQKRISMYLEQEKCTRIIVSHRLSTIKQCSKILVLDGGRIAEQGTFTELSDPGTLFHKLMYGEAL